MSIAISPLSPTSSLHGILSYFHSLSLSLSLSISLSHMQFTTWPHPLCPHFTPCTPMLTHSPTCWMSHAPHKWPHPLPTHILNCTKFLVRFRQMHCWGNSHSQNWLCFNLLHPLLRNHAHHKPLLPTLKIISSIAMKTRRMVRLRRSPHSRLWWRSQ